MKSKVIMIEQRLNGSHTTYYNAKKGEVKNINKATVLTYDEADELQDSLINEFQDAYIIDAPEKLTGVTPDAISSDGKTGFSMKIENRIVQVDENGEFKKTFFYKGDDKRISPVRNHPGVSALAHALERGRQLIESGKANIDNSRRLLS